MNLDEKVAVLTAIQKRAKEMLDELRPEMNERALAEYDENGVTKRAVKVAGQKVADLVVPESKPDFAIVDGSFQEFAKDYGLGRMELSVKDPYEAAKVLAAEHPDMVEERFAYSNDWKDSMEWDGERVTFRDSGMEVPGVAYMGPQPKSPTLRGLKWESVAKALKSLPGGAAGLLEGDAE